MLVGLLVGLLVALLVGKAKGKDPEKTAKKSTKKDAGDDDPVMDRRLFDWLPPPAKDIDSDRDALKNMFTGCDGEKWYIKIGWKTYDDPSRWFGVTVDKVHHMPRVRGLTLKGNELKGETSTSLDRERRGEKERLAQQERVW